MKGNQFMDGVGAPDYLLQQTDRALSVLDLFTPDAPEWSFMEICRETGLSKPTVKRLVYTLLQRRFLEQDEATGRYRLGTKFLTFGRVVAGHMDLLRTAAPHLARLRDESGETVALVQIRDGKQIYLEKLDGRGPLHIKGEAGDIREPYWFLGKVILAHLEPEERQPLLPPWGQPAANARKLYPELDIVKEPYSEKDYLEELSIIKKQGCMVNVQGYFAGHLSIGAPVFDRFGKITAAVGVAALQAGMSEERRIKLVTLVKNTANTISEQLGYNGGGH